MMQCRSSPSAARTCRPAVPAAKRATPQPILCRCEAAKAAALEDLQASQAGLADRLEATAAAAKPSPPPVSGIVPQGVAEIEEIFIDNYYDRIENADAPLVLIDFYTQWCGPCKLMYPKLCTMQAELRGQVSFYKVNCNKAFKELGKELGIKVAPTFMFYKGGEVVATVHGAKLDKLREHIEEFSD